MSVRFKKYAHNGGTARPIRAIRLTENNIDAVAEYVCKNGGAAFVTQGAGGKARRLRIKQLNFGENWGKRDWRVAVVGDFVLYVEEDRVKDFFRMKEDHFEASHSLIK